MKKYKTWEVIKMLEFDNLLEFKCGGGVINYKNRVIEWEDNEPLIFNDVTQTYKWELVKRAVTFEEVLNSGRKCRVEHELMDALTEDECCTSEALIKSINKDICEGKYLLFGSLFLVLSWRFVTDEVKKIIKEGKWYLED